jgi:hypothetical protein
MRWCGAAWRSVQGAVAVAVHACSRGRGPHSQLGRQPGATRPLAHLPSSPIAPHTRTRATVPRAGARRRAAAGGAATAPLPGQLARPQDQDGAALLLAARTAACMLAGCRARQSPGLQQPLATLAPCSAETNTCDMIVGVTRQASAVCGVIRSWRGRALVGRSPKLNPVVSVSYYFDHGPTRRQARNRGAQPGLPPLQHGT